MTRTSLHKSIFSEKQLPQIRVSWTRQELAGLVKLLSRSPEKPISALIRAMKGAA
jgi:hypothetical protein